MSRPDARRTRQAPPGDRCGSARLEALAALVPVGSRVVADIGSGHGRLPRWLLARRHVARCIASEKPGPTARALARLPARAGLEVRTGDGLGVLRDGDGVEVAILAGMGGRTIAGILERGRARTAGLRRVVLQPQRDWADLRRSLFGLGLDIVAERLVEERGRFYLILAAEPRPRPALPRHALLDREDLLEAGPCLVREGGPIVVRYWRERLKRLESIVARAPDARASRAARADRDRALRVLRALGTPPASPKDPLL